MTSSAEIRPLEIRATVDNGSDNAFTLEWTKLVCTPASTALFACPGRTDCVQVRYRHIRQVICESRTVSTDNDVPLFAVDPRYYVIRDVIVI